MSIRSFFTRPILMLKKTEHIVELVKDAEDINKRINELESNISELNKICIKLHSETAKSLQDLSRSFDKRLIDQAGVIEKELTNTVEAVKSLADASGQYHAANTKQINSATSSVAEVSADLTGIRDFLSKSTVQHKRFQEGYDYQVLKNFVKQIIRVVKDLDQEMEKLSDSDTKRCLEYAKDDLVELLEQNSIEQIIPDTDVPYDESKYKYMSVHSERKLTNNSEYHGLIASVTSVGYRYVFNTDQDRVIVPAEVQLYECKTNESPSQPQPAEESEINPVNEEDHDNRSSLTEPQKIPIPLKHDNNVIKDKIVSGVIMFLTVAFIIFLFTFSRSCNNQSSSGEEVEASPTSSINITGE